MAGLEVSTDEIAARLSAIEYLVRQLYSAEFKRYGGEPLEHALATQGAMMGGLQKKLGALQDDDPDKSRISRTIDHINRIVEDVVQGYEQQKK